MLASGRVPSGPSSPAIRRTLLYAYAGHSTTSEYKRSGTGRPITPCGLVRPILESCRPVLQGRSAECRGRSRWSPRTRPTSPSTRLIRNLPFPLIHIVDTARDAADAQGFRRLGIFGTRFVMEAPMYPERFGARGMTVLAPNTYEREYIHEKYVSELVPALPRPNARRLFGDHRQDAGPRRD